MSFDPSSAEPRPPMTTSASLESLRRTRSAPHVQLPPSAHSHTSRHSQRRDLQGRSEYPEDVPNLENLRSIVVHPRGIASTPASPGASEPFQLASSLNLPPPVAPLGSDAEADPAVFSGGEQPRRRRTGRRRRDQPDPNADLLNRVRFYFGYGINGDRARKARVQFLVGTAWYFSQLTACITILAIAAHRESPTLPGRNEWGACRRPIQVWVIIWALKTTLSLGLCRWTYVMDRQMRSNMDTLDQIDGDVNAARGTANPSGTRPARPETMSADRRRTLETVQRRALPHAAIYSRLSMFSTFITLVWFLTAHILEYTTIDTCRISAPHLWWMIFAIMCIMYVMVLEVLFLGFVVFIIAPITFLFCNILLLVIGRHPYQNPNNTVLRPEIGKLSKSVVDKIPLVIYIPPPPDEADKDAPPTVVEKQNQPGTSFAYPPTPKKDAAPKKRKFRFLRLKKRSKPSTADEDKQALPSGPAPSQADAELGEARWEDRWEEHEAYPFVRIGGNRAVCSICLVDFEEPARRGGASGAEAEAGQAEALAESGSGSSGVAVPVSPSEPQVEEQHVAVEEEPRNEEEADKLRLADAGAGEGPELLRLLGCGHAFHQTCVDPWLTNVSGRCPVCQQAIEVPEKEKKNSR